MKREVTGATKAVQYHLKRTFSPLKAVASISSRRNYVRPVQVKLYSSDTSSKKVPAGPL